MCGIIAILRRRSRRPAPAVDTVRAYVQRGAAFAANLDPTSATLATELDAAAAEFEAADEILFGPPGIRTLADAPEFGPELRAALEQAQAQVDACEAALDAASGAGATTRQPADIEAINAATIRLRDALWAVLHDRLDTAEAALALAGSRASDAALDACFSIQSALSALDRLEVRGRDSAGVHVLVTGHGLVANDSGIREALRLRSRDSAFRSMSVRVTPTGAWSFVYKRAAEIGELGDNVAALRAAIAGDELLHRAIHADKAEIQVVGHTRWASIGIISEPNAHPLNSEESDHDSPHYVIGVLNGDVDNHAELVREHELNIEQQITTDAKVIPTLVTRRLDEGVALGDAFRTTVQGFEGSVAIAAAAADDPHRQLLALRGSGQALYVGLAEDTFVVASEPYGVTELTDRYLRLDGETPGNPQNPTGSRGQVVVLDRKHAGETQGLRRIAYDGTDLPVADTDLTRAPVTTRDVDRGAYPHYLLKEITESPRSFRKTLRGRITDGAALQAQLGPESLPAEVAADLHNGTIKRIVVIGQGTAAVAGRGVLAALELAFAGSPISLRAMPATELSGFKLRSDMRDELVIAISQSGTTTDTNRTVDLVRNRGARVLAIVNRRGSDLTDKADGVLYTSDGRDVEMSVASTKAFYAQVAAGFVLSFALARAAGQADPGVEHEVLTALRAMPDAMETVLGRRDLIRAAAAEFATKRRYWAVVGNGNNQISAAEIRIKLSELCYKSIACDATEDKKHIDLSAEPLILVCAAGLRGSTVDDVAKEVAIYRAHQSAPIVIASEGEERFSAAHHTIPVPNVHPALDFVLSAVVGHLFGYEAALAIDAMAMPLREARSAIERAVAATPRPDGDELLRTIAPDLAVCGERFFADLKFGRLDGQLEASTAAQLASLLRYALGIAPLDSYQIEHGKVGSPSEVLEDLTTALTAAIEELTRPVDAIKHQAKTVTVGISRSDETLLGEPLVQSALDAGMPRDAITYDELRSLAALSPLVAETVGYSRYAVAFDAEGESAIRQIDAGGIAADMVSRTDSNPVLKGTKHRVARERRLLVARGQNDDRTVILVPESDGKQTVGITLLHVRFETSVDATTLRSALAAYRNRWAQLEDAVTETESTVRLDLLEDLPVLDALIAPIDTLAKRWRGAAADQG